MLHFVSHWFITVEAIQDLVDELHGFFDIIVVEVVLGFNQGGDELAKDFSGDLPLGGVDGVERCAQSRTILPPNRGLTQRIRGVQRRGDPIVAVRPADHASSRCAPRRAKQRDQPGSARIRAATRALARDEQKLLDDLAGRTSTLAGAWRQAPETSVP